MNFKKEITKPSLASLSDDHPLNRLIWSSLSFQSGIVNVAAFLLCHRFVTHTTGFATQFGADLALMKWSEALGMIMVPVLFLIGSMISAFYVDKKIHDKKKAEYTILFFLISALFGFVLLMGYFGLFIKINDKMNWASEVTLVSFLCLAAGIQNAAMSTASNNFVRTTHLTGLTTDLGIGLVRRFYNKNNHEKKANQVRLILIFSFIIGSACGAYLFIKFDYLVFLIPFLISSSIYTYLKITD